ncbi:hypothetical protein EV146_114146 [Mesobacillus foraminis]|uniref:Uncharacterized protein n=1 Tax=Mesobacillus foraminis TaxID=279826 RepID=A0A4R2B2M0_9BACI|nr:hypothetical protein EV146_114146 [Mesobacillus foraminis]
MGLRYSLLPSVRAGRSISTVLASSAKIRLNISRIFCVVVLNGLRKPVKNKSPYLYGKERCSSNHTNKMQGVGLENLVRSQKKWNSQCENKVFMLRLYYRNNSWGEIEKNLMI